MPISRALSSPDIIPSVGLRGTWVSHVCSPSQFLGPKGTATGPTAGSRRSQRHFLRPAQPLPPRLHLLVGESPDLPGGDPCLGLTRSLRMFVSNEVNIGQEVTLSHMTACCFGPTPIMLLSVPPTLSA